MNLLIRNFTKYNIRKKDLEFAARLVLSEEHFKRDTEISLVFTGEKRIKALNKKYRGIDRVTDVLSFEGENDDGFVDPKNDISYLGEIFICYYKAKKQAYQKGQSVQKEIDHLLIHGILHLLGYDHIKDSDYEIMKKREEMVLSRLHG
jgi:probable rRNA maturation factor